MIKKPNKMSGFQILPIGIWTCSMPSYSLGFCKFDYLYWFIFICLVWNVCKIYIPILISYQASSFQNEKIISKYYDFIK